MRYSVGFGLGPFRVTQPLRFGGRSEAQKDRDEAERKQWFANRRAEKREKDRRRLRPRSPEEQQANALEALRWFLIGPWVVLFFTCGFGFTIGWSAWLASVLLFGWLLHRQSQPVPPEHRACECGQWQHLDRWEAHMPLCPTGDDLFARAHKFYPYDGVVL